MTQFSDLNLDPKVLKAILEAGYETPTPIQAGAIPPALEGRDVLGIAQTGTGKTASFTLPMIHMLGRGRARARMPRSLVLAPTRELAAQVAANFDTYAKHTKLTKALLIGGVSFKEQDALIDKGVDVLIATPGRLLDHFERGKLLLTGVQVMVVDEADRMLDMGFIPDIERIFSLTPFTRQTLFFSATMAPEIERITNTFLSNPARIEVARAATTGENIKQGVIMFKPSRKDREGSEKRALLRRVIEGETELTNAIIFCNRKMDVDVVAKSLKKAGLNAEPIHGDLDQAQRTRTLDGFREGRVTFLVASDVAARGLDIPAVSHVINYDVPSHAEDYVHRIGRTGRAGRKGTTVMICAAKDEKNLAAIESLVQSEIPRLEGSAQPAETAPAAEPAHADAAPAPAAEQAEDKPKRSRTRRRTRSTEAETAEAAPQTAPEAQAQPEPAKQAEPEPAAEATAKAEPAPAQAEEPAAEPRKPASRGRGRGSRGQKAQETAAPAAEEAPAPEAPAAAPAPAATQDPEDKPRQRGRGKGGREPSVVGLGEDVPSFIALSFAERRAS
ncbi:DEAD/DEAH box helicase [Pseudoroseicyclus aestuarii]|uniref:DEAD-box ATP-dependent RNA helicase RhpA n=1 Tax=Pseudoroseicyclus aestuarii TaxID=1795041 RepID=A0A318SQJ0_9RHOB|nr:DEAD/DEAH box helicase [Pseudoroseicyclus aestuarii]PYE84160.1 superfamily II DNA/RNA helicase [Pseudoroseicyclus aestuarii]